MMGTNGIPLIAVLTLVFASCGGEAAEMAPTTSSSTLAADLPAGVPATFPQDLEPADLPPAALVPPEAEVIGLWFARTSAGDALVVAWADPNGGPHRDGGMAAWRRFGDDPPWRAVYGTAVLAEDRVLGVRTTTADVTGDGSEDALVVQNTGGSGSCGRYRVIDLLAGKPVWERDLCDAQVDPSATPVGLVVLEALFEEGDAHCCPSGFRRTVLTYEGEGRWMKASVELGVS